MNSKSSSRDEEDSSGRRRPGKRLFTLFTASVLLIVAGTFLVPWIFDFYTDGYSIHQSSREALIRNILWEHPVTIEGTINENPENYEPTLSRDGLTMVFTRGKAQHNADLYVARWTGQAWGEPALLESINSPADELGPELSRDGRFLYFYSDRPGGFGGYDIWVSRWDGKEWTAPENTGAKINSGFNEYGPGLTPDGDRLFFSSNRLRRELTQEEKEAWHATLRENFLASDYDIFSAAVLNAPDPLDGHAIDTGDTGDTGDTVDGVDTVDAVDGVEGDFLPSLPEFEKATRVGGLNSPGDEGQVAMTPRGDFIYFSSNRRGGLGGFDLYRSRIFHDEYLEPENMGAPVNSDLDDMDPSLILEGYGLVFSSNRMKTEGQRPFLLYKTVSREVIVRKDFSALHGLLRLLDRFKWPLLFLLLGLMALLLLLRYLASQRFRMHASLLQKCMLASLLLHLLLALLLSTWVVSSSIYDMAGDSTGEMRLDMDALAEESLGLEIREQVADLEAAQDDAALDEPKDTLASLVLVEPTLLQEREIEPDDAPARFAIALPAPEPEPDRKQVLAAVSQTSALKQLELDDLERALEVPAPSAARSEPEFPTLQDATTASQAISQVPPSHAQPVRTQQVPEDQNDSQAHRASLMAEARADERPVDASAALPPHDAQAMPRTLDEGTSVHIAMEIPEPKQQESRTEPVQISGPQSSSRVDQSASVTSETPRPETSTAPYLKDQTGRFKFSAIATEKIDPIANGIDEPPLPTSRVRQTHEAPDDRPDIVMELPSRKSGPAVKEPEIQVEAEPAGRIESMASLEETRPVNAQTRLPAEALETVARPSSPLQEARTEPRELPDQPPSLPRVAQQVLEKDHDSLVPKIVLEKPSAAKAVQMRKEVPPLKAPGAVAQMDHTSSVSLPRTAERKPIDLDEPAKVRTGSAVANLKTTAPRALEPELPRHTVKSRPLVSSQSPMEISATSTLETPDKASRREAAPKRDLERIEVSRLTGPISLDHDVKPPRLDPPAPLEPQKVKQRPVTVDLPFPVTIREREPEIDRFEHDVPRTYHGLEMKSRKVVLCLDVSRSMEWNNRIGDARQELLRLLDTLDEAVEFNIITFAGTVRVWNRYGVQPGTKKNLKSAKQFTRSARIASDGTNTVSALAMALADENVESIFFLSDGHPTVGFTTNSRQILRHVRELQAGRNVAIHTIAYIKGDPPRSYRNQVPPKDELIFLMKRLAEENNGNFVVFDE